MKIQVSEIPEQGLDVKDVEALEYEAAGVVEKAVLRLNVQKVEADVYLRGALETSFNLTCSRCLEGFKREVSIPIELEYHPVEELGREETHELSADELDTGFYTGDELDLGEVSREQVLLNMPMKPLCSEACRGICPRCGANLNEGPCGCDLRQADDRLKDLDKFLKGGKE